MKGLEGELAATEHFNGANQLSVCSPRKKKTLKSQITKYNSFVADGFDL